MILHLIFVVVSANTYIKFIKSVCSLSFMKKIEERIIETLKNPDSARQIKYLSLDLIANGINLGALIELATIHKVENKLGYLAEISAIAAKKAGIDSYRKLNRLVAALGNASRDWEYLEATLPDYAKRIIANSPQSEYNKKWKIYSALRPEDLHDWVKLYGLKQNAPVLSESRTY
jgi:hypothetical protein